jgi:hypothetical protein
MEIHGSITRIPYRFLAFSVIILIIIIVAL